MKHTHSRRSRVARFLILLSLLIVLFAAAILLDRYNTFLKRKKDTVGLRYKTQVVKLFHFSDERSLGEWEEKIFKGRVVYSVEKNGGLSYVRARSKGAASALYYRINLDAKNKRPFMGWKWRVEKFPDKKMPENLDTQNEDDFAARVYVIFPGVFFTNSKVLEYVWARDLPVGMQGTSPYSKNIKLIVLRSGPDKDARWFDEERDIEADYMQMFGRTPEYDIGAIAFMTNTEHTGTTADAMYDDIKIGYREGVSSQGKEGSP